MYYVITDTGVKSSRTPKGFKEIKAEASDFVVTGKDHVLKLTNDDISFFQDKNILSAIPIRNLYKADNTVKIVLIINVILTLICLIKG